MHYFTNLSRISTCSGQFVRPSSGVYSLRSQQCYMSYRLLDRFRAGPRWNWVPSWSCSKAVYKPVWHTPLLSSQWINSWRWTEELSETCRDSWQNKFVKLVHLVGFITKKFITMHGHVNLKTLLNFSNLYYYYTSPHSLQPNWAIWYLEI
jgi:hypothetical protein